MNTNEIIKFRYQGTEIRSILKDEQTWFVAKDVCDYFGDSHYLRTLNKLNQDEKDMTPLASPGGIQSTAIINEPGIYHLLFRMQPQRKASIAPEEFSRRLKLINDFRHWVTHEVLPSIYKRGYYYNYPASGFDQTAGLIFGLAKQMVHLEDRVGKLEAQETKVAEIKAPVKLTTTRTKLNNLIRGYAEANCKEYREVWGELYKEFKDRYHVDLFERMLNSKNKTGAQIAEQMGHIEDLYTLAQYLFVEAH